MNRLKKNIMILLVVIISVVLAIFIFNHKKSSQSEIASYLPIPESHLIFLSPHSDDSILTFGGLMLNHHGFPEKEKENIIFFNISKYSIQKNMEHVEQQIREISTIRFAEDLSALSFALNGVTNFTYTALGYKDAPLRDKPNPIREDFSTFSNEDIEIFNSVKEYVQSLLIKDDCALFVLSAVPPTHIDHFIIREAVIKAASELKHKATCQIFFGEDQPYTGSYLKQSQQFFDELSARLGLQPIAYPIDIDKKISLFADHYKSQFTPGFEAALRARALQVGEQIYLWPKGQYGIAASDSSCQYDFCRIK